VRSRGSGEGKSEGREREIGLEVKPNPIRGESDEAIGAARVGCHGVPRAHHLPATLPRQASVHYELAPSKKTIDGVSSR
jgi:hypothetical protein